MKREVRNIGWTKEERKQIKDNIKTLRIAAGFETQFELSEAMGIPYQGFSDRVNKGYFKDFEITRLLQLLNARYEQIWPAWVDDQKPKSEVEQIIATAIEQAERGELTPSEMQTLFEQYGAVTVIDGDRQAS